MDQGLSQVVTSQHSDQPRLSQSTHASLLRRLKANDQDAWRVVVRLYAPLVYYWFGQYGVRQEDRADVFQEIFRAVARNIEKFRWDESGHTFRGWLHTITRSKITDHYRRNQRHAAAMGGSDAKQQMHQFPDLLDESDPGQSESTESAQLVKQILMVMQERFELKTWKAFWKMTIDGLTATEAGEDLDMKPDAVRRAKYRVLKRLRDEFGDFLEE